MSDVDRTGRLATLLPSLNALKRGSAVVHVAEERRVPIPGGGTFTYPEFTSLCGVGGWGAASGESADATCVRCRRTARFRESLGGAA